MYVEVPPGAEFFASLQELFAEANARGIDSTRKADWKFLKESVSNFLEACARTTGARARATNPVTFPRGEAPQTSMTLPPSDLVRLWDEKLRKKLLRQTSGNEFVGMLRGVYDKQTRPAAAKVAKTGGQQRQVALQRSKRKVVIDSDDDSEFELPTAKQIAKSVPAEKKRKTESKHEPTIASDEAIADCQTPEPEHEQIPHQEPPPEEAADAEPAFPFSSNSATFDDYHGGSFDVMCQAPEYSMQYGTAFEDEAVDGLEWDMFHDGPLLPGLEADEGKAAVASTAELKQENDCCAGIKKEPVESPFTALKSKEATSVHNGNTIISGISEDKPGISSEYSRKITVSKKAALALRQHRIEKFESIIGVLGKEISSLCPQRWAKRKAQLQDFCVSTRAMRLTLPERLSRIARLVYVPDELALMSRGQWESLRALLLICGAVAQVVAPDNEEDGSAAVNAWFRGRMEDHVWLELAMRRN